MLYEIKTYENTEILKLKNYSPTEKEVYEFFADWLKMILFFSINIFKL